jgi:hypothetical protein
MKKLFLLLMASALSTSIFAQSAPILPKEWKGSSTATSLGAVNRFNLKHPDLIGEADSAKEWNIYNEPRTLTVLRQEGRHIELLLKGPKHETTWIGTLSKDGKQLQVAGKGAHVMFNLSGDSLSGCGTSRGTNGTFTHWFREYTSMCFDFVAVK